MDGPPPQEEDFSQLSIADRLCHKSWKARLSGYETLIKTFQKTSSDTDPAFKPYLNDPSILKNIAADSNAVAQEKGLEALVAFVKYSGETSTKTRDVVAPTLVDKCLSSSRGGTRSSALELLMQYVEVENSGTGVVGDVLQGLSAKQPKIVAASVLILKELLRTFGPQVVAPPPLLKSLPKIFGHTDKSVRAEGTLLAHTLYQAIGPAIEPFLAELKAVQIKELHEAFERMDSEGSGKSTLKPIRYTRAYARQAEDRHDAVDETPEEKTALDPRTMMEAVDIVPKLPQGLQASLMSSKWKERKESLDELLKVLGSALRIKDAPELNDVTKALAGRMSDANINCVITAALCLEALAKGLMENFARFREVAVPPVLERLKERKQSVVDALGAALDAAFATMSLSDILPDIMQALSNKNPQVKEGTMKFLTRCLSSTSTSPSQAQIKALSETLAALLEDSFEGIRNEAAVSLGTLMKIVGERPLNGVMEQLADVRKVKVKEACEKATIKFKSGGMSKVSVISTATKKISPSKTSDLTIDAEEAKLKPPARLLGRVNAKNTKLMSSDVATDSENMQTDPKTTSRLTGQKGTATAEQNSTLESVDALGKPVVKPAGKPPARLLEKRAAAKEDTDAISAVATSKPAVKQAVKKTPGNIAISSAKSKPATSSISGALDSFKFKHPPEEADALILDLIPTSIAADFSDSNWKARLAALDEMITWLDGAVEEVDSEIVIRFLAKKGWNEKNFQVSAKLYSVLQLLAERCPSFGRPSVALAVPHLSEKLGDAKLKKPAGDVLLLFAEKTSLQFVLGQMYEPLGKQKAPKVMSDSLVWIDQALADFGVSGLVLRNLIDFLKAALGNSNAAVRTNATKTLVTVKLFVGSSVRDLLTEVNPQLLANILAEFDKCEGIAAPQPSKKSNDLVGMSSTIDSIKGPVSDPMDDLFPRVEIDSLLKGTAILADAKSDAWKTRKEALEGLQAILEQGPNKRMKSTMGEIGQVLKTRLNDTNKAVQLLALDIVARIATGMGKPFEKHVRTFVPPVTTILADQKANIRSAALATLSSIATACEGLESMAHSISTALESSNPIQRSSLLNWLADWFKIHESSSSLDLCNWVGSIIASLDDRNTDVRKSAQAVLPFIILHVGLEYALQQTNSLKPASRTSVIPLLKSAAASLPQNSSLGNAASPSLIQNNASNSPRVSVDISSAAEPSVSTEITKPTINKLIGVRKKLPQGSTVRPDSRLSANDEVVPSRLPSKSNSKKPNSAAVSSSRVNVETPSSYPTPFVTSTMDAKKGRLMKDSGRWIIESGPVRKDLLEALRNQMETHVSPEVTGQLFSHDHNAVSDYIAGLGSISDLYTELNSGDNNNYQLSADRRVMIGSANSDLVLKYASMRAHEPQPNLISKCLDVIENVVTFYRITNQQLTDLEAISFIPSVIFKMGDAREAVRTRVQQIIQGLPRVYAYSRVFQMLLDYGLKAKVAKTRQGSLEEIAGVLKQTGLSACDPPKAFPVLATMISDKDAQVRKAALAALSEGFTIVGDNIWSLIGKIPSKDRTQLEERLRRVNPPSENNGTSRVDSPALSSRAGVPQRAMSPAISIASSNIGRPASPHIPTLNATRTQNTQSVPGPSSPTNLRPKSFLPSRLGTQSRPGIPRIAHSSNLASSDKASMEKRPVLRELNGDIAPSVTNEIPTKRHDPDVVTEEITVSLTISRVLSSDTTRSVDALKSIQKILEISQEDGPHYQQYRELSDHTQGLIETITLQMGHVFENASSVGEAENFRLAKHLIQTINAFCDHPIMAESLQADILTALFEELTLRLLQTDESPNSKIKDLSRFINMILLRLFATCRRMTVIRALFALLLRIVKPFPNSGSAIDSKEAKVAELVLKCIWKLARNIPTDLEKQELDPVELFPSIEHFLQSIPPNEWRARATNKIPSGDMPLRTIKVIIQHVVAHYGDDVYDLLSSSFEDPSATIVYPYVFRILNTNRTNNDRQSTEAAGIPESRASFSDNRAVSPQATSSRASNEPRSPSLSHRTSRSFSSVNAPGHYISPVQEPDPDEQLLTIINHISSETTGAMHKEGITELHQFIKAYPHKKPRVERMLESTGPAFRKYIARALASRAAEDEERTVAVADTLQKLESNQRSRHYSSSSAQSQNSPSSARRSSNLSDATQAEQDKLTRLHDLFQYRGSASSHGGSSSRANNDLDSTENVNM